MAGTVGFHSSWAAEFLNHDDPFSLSWDISWLSMENEVQALEGFFVFVLKEETSVHGPSIFIM